MKKCIPVSVSAAKTRPRTPAASKSYSKKPSQQAAQHTLSPPPPNMKRPQAKGRKHSTTRKETHDRKVAGMVYSQIATNSQSQLDLLFISTPIPYPCRNHSTSKQARDTSHSSKIKKHMKMRRGDSSWRDLRFRCRCSLGAWLSSLGLLGLSNLLSLLWCISRCSLGLAAI